MTVIDWARRLPPMREAGCRFRGERLGERATDSATYGTDGCQRIGLRTRTFREPVKCFQDSIALSGTRPSAFVGALLHTHELAQLIATTRQAGAYCSDRNVQDRRDLLIGHTF
jgi:hypothetical protein